MSAARSASQLTRDGEPPVTRPSVSPADATAGCGTSQHAPHAASEHHTLPQRLTTNVKWRPWTGLQPCGERCSIASDSPGPNAAARSG
jgi:hypothetical protein